MDRLLLLASVGFALGLLAASLGGLPPIAAAFPILLTLVFSLLWLSGRAPLYAALCAFFLCASLGMARVALSPLSLPDAFLPLVGAEAEIEGVVVADPDIREQHQRLTVRVERNQGDALVWTNVLVVAPLYPEIRYGERLRAYGTLEEPEPFETNEGRMFGYDRFLAKDGIFLVMERGALEIIGGREGFWHSARGALSDFKFAGIDALARALPEPHASLASGLLLGGKQGLGKDLLDDFVAVGLVHIVVLSGYNVMIVAEFVLRLFGLISRRLAPVAAGVTIAAFVLAAGAGAASVRAGVMAGIALYGRATGRTYDAFRALIAAGVLMLLANPLLLAYDPGFQLSFVATLGLIFGAPVIERKLAWVRSAFMREIAAATLAAQIAVLPLLLYQNGLLSLAALPANLLVLPVVPAAMLLSALAGAAGALAPLVAPVIGFPAYLLLSYITGVATFGASIPLASLSVPAFPFALVIAAYAALALLVAKQIKVTP